jgi:hypothetical protein
VQPRLRGHSLRVGVDARSDDRTGDVRRVEPVSAAHVHRETSLEFRVVRLCAAELEQRQGHTLARESVRRVIERRHVRDPRGVHVVGLHLPLARAGHDQDPLIGRQGLEGVRGDGGLETARR